MDLMLSQWWVGLVIAIVIYLIGSNATSIVSFDSQLMGVFNVLLSLAEDFAFVISVPFVLISIVAWFKAKHRSKLLERQNDIESIRDLSWQDFEVLVGEACRRQGYTVEETGGGGADGGIDLRLRKNGNLAIVQCKRWKTQRVGVSPIRELFGLMIAEQAQSAIFVCSGSYTKDALQFADQNGISLVDGDALYGLVEDVQETPI
ncbi:MAG: restriction endonuclease, partial [Marinoscillum sp.]